MTDADDIEEIVARLEYWDSMNDEYGRNEHDHDVSALVADWRAKKDEIEKLKGEVECYASAPHANVSPHHVDKIHKV